jgi:hypothetical protein
MTTTRNTRGCEDCGRKVNNSIHPTLCQACYDYAGWENTHSDDAHGTDNFTGVPTDTDICPVCHPELAPTAPKAGHTNTATKTHTSHAGCAHAATPKDRAACRKANTWNGTAWV